mgnify:FL=1
MSECTICLFLQTNAKLKALSISCPEYMQSTYEYECLITAAGNKMAVDLDFADGTSIRALELGGSCFMYYVELD